MNLSQLKRDAKKRKIIYSRFTKPAKQLLELAGSVQAAKKAISKVAEWAKSRDLDYAIETVFKKVLEGYARSTCFSRSSHQKWCEGIVRTKSN